MLDAMFQSCPDQFVPIFFDEAGHRVATQYLLSAIRGALPAEKLCDYRKGHAGLPGHPERDPEIGVEFASGRLGHMWPYVNGVAMANKNKVTPRSRSSVEELPEGSEWIQIGHLVGALQRPA